MSSPTILSPVDAAFARVLRADVRTPTTPTPFSRRTAVYALAALPEDTQVGADPSITAGELAEYHRDHLPLGDGFYNVGRVLDVSAWDRRTPTPFRTFDRAVS